VKHRVDGILWYYYGRGLRGSEQPGVNGPLYLLERDIHAQTGRRYWNAYWCPYDRWMPRKERVLLGRAHGDYLAAARYAELHSVTQPDRYYRDQLKEERRAQRWATP
jgi:hypothetical protein